MARPLLALVAVALLAACSPRPTTVPDASGSPPADQAQVESSTDVDRSDLSAVQDTCPGETVVWVNTNSGIYHLPGERWYGATESGEYWCQPEADGQGFRETRNGQ